MIHSLVRSNAYQDSVNLMRLSTRLRELPGIRDAAVMMGTALNKERYHDGGLLTPEIEAAEANDLCIAIDAEDEAAIAAALEEIELHLGSKRRAGATLDYDIAPRTLESALSRLPDADLAMISVPGAYAAAEAERALRRGLHVFLFSDNVPIEDEVRLKTLAADRGLLCMGPDCGSAIVAGLPLGFANVVPRGPVGVISASGTGLQEVACRIARGGLGISHAIGTGGRDLTRPVGGRAFLAALRALARDPSTRVLVLVSKPPDPSVEAAILEEARRAGKPTVVVFIGGRPDAARAGGATGVETLAEAADAAVALARGAAWDGPSGHPGSIDPSWVAAARDGLVAQQRFIRGLYSGGTLADEAAVILRRRLGQVWALTPMEGVRRLADPERSVAHSVVDLGEDVFTRGRPHPMIDPTLRAERLCRECGDPDVAVILLDIVLGHGAHPDPASPLVSAIRDARQRRSTGQGAVAFVAALVGTEADPQRYSRQRALLEEAGVYVAESNAEAALAAASVAAG